MKDRIRVASLQYFIRPVQTFEQFRDPVEALVETAADYDCELLVFSEYFTVQLLTLGQVKRPIRVQIRELARQVPQYTSLMRELANQHSIYVIAGSIPIAVDSANKVCNQSFFFGPSGNFGVQGKLHMTRFEAEDWGVSASSGFKIFCPLISNINRERLGTLD